MNPDSTDAHRRPDRLRLLVAVVTALAAVLVIVPSAFAGGKLLVYTGNGGINEGYTTFANAAGRTVTTSPLLPATDPDWDQYACVMLPISTVGYTPTQQNSLNSYMSRGGTVVAIAEHLNADPAQQVGPASVTTMNNVAAGTGIQALNTTRNQGPTVSTNPSLGSLPVGGVAAKYRKDVTRVGFAATTTLTVTAPAVALVSTVKTEVTDPDPAPFLAIREYGSNAGKFVYAGDSNVFSEGGGGYFAGNDNAKLARNICGDINPPTITITTPQDGARYRKDQTFPGGVQWTCSDPDSDIDPLLTTATAQVGDPVDTDVPDGQTVTKTFTVSCTDKVGNSATKTVTYKVDGNKPVVVIDTPVNLGTYNRNSSVPADWHCEDGDGPTDIDTAPDKTFGTVAPGASIDTLLPLGGAPVVKNFSATCTDKAGNTATKPVSYTVEDQNPPVATITSPLDGARFTIGKSVLAAWTCTDPPDGQQDIDTDENKTFGTVPVGQPIDTTGVVGQTVPKTFTVVCTDLAGNVTTKIHTYYIDGNPPVVTIAVPIDGGTYPRGSNQPANWGCTDPDGESDIKSKVPTLPVGIAINTGTLGPKSFTVTCTDQAGNVSTKVVSYTVIGGPPDITIKIPVNGAVFEQGAVVSPSYTCNDLDNDLKTCVREGGATGPINTSKPGTYTFTVNASDAAGNTATKSVTYTVKAKGTVAGSVAPSGAKSKATKACSSRRQFRIRVKKLKGGVSAVSATVFVNGKKTVTRKGKRVTAIVTLKGLKKGTYKVKINVKYSNGRVLSYTRKFRTCVPKGK